jgi:thymidine phosphorylase
MNPLGNIMRDFLKQAHAKQVKMARALAEEFLQEKMAMDQIEEMLYASGFEAAVIDEAMDSLPKKGKK